MGKDLDKIAEEIIKYREEKDIKYKEAQEYYQKIIDNLILKASNEGLLSIEYEVPVRVLPYLLYMLEAEELHYYKSRRMDKRDLESAILIISVPPIKLENSIKRILQN